MSSRPLLLAAAVFLSPLAGCMFTDPFTAKRRETVQLKHVEGASIEVRSRNGSIQVLGDAQRRDVEVHAELVACGSTQKEADDRLTGIELHCARAAGGRLVVHAAFPGERRGRDRASYVIRLPFAAGGQLKSSNGSITVRSIGGQLVATTANGSITVSDHAGAVKLRSSNGRVSASNISGATNVHTSNGSVHVELDSDNAGPVQARTSNGGVRATVGAAFRGKVAMRTSNGRLRFENGTDADVSYQLHKRKGTVIFSKGGGTSELRSSNGSITLRLR